MAPILGLDYGRTRIGVALSDPTNTLASALYTHRSAVDGSILAYLKDLVQEQGITAIVMGLPLTLAGTEGEMAKQVRTFAKLLENNLGLPIILQDERFKEPCGMSQMPTRGADIGHGLDYAILGTQRCTEHLREFSYRLKAG